MVNECLNCGKETNNPKFCSRSCAATYNNKLRIRTDKSKEMVSRSLKKFYEENPDKKTPAKNYKCKYCGKTFTIHDYRDVSGRTYCSAKCRENWLNENWKPNIGGYRKGSGHGKSGWYKGIYCDSSWELAFVIYHKDNDMYIERCREKLEYVFDGKKHFYFPDFKTNIGIVEIKGYSTPRWEAKIRQNPDIKVLYKDDMNFYINYCKEKYGDDYIKLYE